MKFGIYNAKDNNWCGDIGNYEFDDLNKAYKQVNHSIDSGWVHLKEFFEVREKYE